MKFSIRDLLWLTVVVALAVGWWVDRTSYRGLREENSRLSKKLKETDRMLWETVYVLSRKEDRIVGPMTDRPKSSALAPNLPKP